ncbi:MAG TPA: hypothetical protein VG166_00940, partial [Caulobacteraceae bacterium]|nr:hypothetical protein [Caulobacteraceae bacterium]
AMTTKTLSSFYSGYTLSAAYSALKLTSSATLVASAGAAYGDDGHTGLTLAFNAPVSNAAYLISGGDGHIGEQTGGMTQSGPGGSGGNAVDLGGGGNFTNSGSIQAGKGGAGALGFGGGHGGAGGIGVSLGAGGNVDNSWRIAGGAGGVGGQGTYGGGGGAGGVALSFAAGGSVTNSDTVQGGAGAAGGARGATVFGKGSAGSGGRGGDGIVLTQRGRIDNVIGGAIAGGNGGKGGAGGAGGVNGADGGGGDGVLMAGGGVVSNAFEISGGSGGVKGDGGDGVFLEARGNVINNADIFGGHGGSSASGGMGVRLGVGGSIYNSGLISGGYGDLGGVAGDGVKTGAGATLQNLGFIYGGNAQTGGGAPGVGVYMAGGAIYNGDLIRGGMVSGGTDGVGVYIGGGSVINGGAAHPTAFIYGLVGVAADSGAVTVTNLGTIGGYLWSVDLRNTADRLIVGSGAKFEGPVHGGGGTLELAAGAQTITGMGGATVAVSGSTPMTITGFGGYVVDAAASLSLTGSNVLNTGDTLTANGALGLAAGASLLINDGATAQIGGAVGNAGDITLGSSTAVTTLRVLAAGATLSGGGKVNLTGPKSRISGTTASATLTNVNDTIIGSGSLGLGSMTLVNEAGAIEASGKQGLIIDTKGRTAVNSGNLVSLSGSTLTVRDTTLDQSGGGVIYAPTGGRVLLSDAVIIGGYLTQTGGTMLVNTSGGAFDGTGARVQLNGTIGVASGVTLTLEGEISVQNRLNALGGANVTKLIVGAAGVTLDGFGQVNLSASLNNIIVGAASGDTLTNVDDRIAGAGDIGDGSMVLVNQAKGQIVGNGAVTLTLDTGSHTIVNAGTIESSGAGQVVVKSAVTNTGLLYAAAGTLILDKTVSGTGAAHIKAGVLDIAGGFAETVTFVSGATGTLELTDFKGFTGHVKGLSLTGANAIDLAGFTLAGAKATYSGTTAAGVLTVTNGTQTARINLTGDYTAATFTVASDGHGGVLVKDPPIAALTQAMAAFQNGAAPHLTDAAAWRLQHIPLLHARA